MTRPTGLAIEAWLRRTALFGLTGATAWFGAHEMYLVLESNGFTAFEWALLGLFILSFSWLALAFWTSVAGALSLIFGIRSSGFVEPAPDAPLPNVTALVVPIYNEDPARVFANIQSMVEHLRAAGQGDAFHVYVLSDTQDPDRWVEEEVAWSAMVARLKAGGRIFYRRRPKNSERKAGNIADFCRRWGSAYPYMIVLDADSLMTAGALVGLVRMMDANPRAGLIQAAPVMLGRNTLFGRVVQFAAGLYGPVFAAGFAFWQLSEGNYWGHNAIIRSQAFLESCGLPHLPGRAPFGGHILSHDFVEAALMRRAGWEVWMAPIELGGSFEEAPPNLLDYLKRDRRWCQGNLQHASIVFAQGLHWVSRIHLATGIFGYLMSPIWLSFLLLNVANEVWVAITPHNYFPDEPSLFPNWVVYDAERARYLLVSVVLMLTLPRVLAILSIAILGRVRQFGGWGALVISTASEMLVTTLAAPVMMLFQSRYIVEILLGRDSGWSSPTRDDGGIDWNEAFERHWMHMVLAVVLAYAATAYVPDLWLWLAPIFTALLLSAPFSWLMARTDLGYWTRRRRLFLIPEEIAPPAELIRAQEIGQTLRERSREPLPALEHVMRDPLAYAVHLSLLPVNAAFHEPDGELLDTARYKLRRAGLKPENANLNRAETSAVLLDRTTLDELHERALVDAALKAG